MLMHERLFVCLTLEGIKAYFSPVLAWCNTFDRAEEGNK